MAKKIGAINKILGELKVPKVSVKNLKNGKADLEVAKSVIENGSVKLNVKKMNRSKDHYKVMADNLASKKEKIIQQKIASGVSSDKIYNETSRLRSSLEFGQAKYNGGKGGTYQFKGGDTSGIRSKPKLGRGPSKKKTYHAKNHSWLDRAEDQLNKWGKQAADYYWNNATPGERFKRIGLTAGGWMGANTALRYMNGGDMLHNPDGENDLAGVPLI